MGVLAEDELKAIRKEYENFKKELDKDINSKTEEQPKVEVVEEGETTKKSDEKEVVVEPETEKKEEKKQDIDKKEKSTKKKTDKKED